MWDISPFLTALLVYSVGAAAPGPGNLLIARTAMNYGRKAGFALATGVISGSVCWGILIATGISSILISYPYFVQWLKLLGAAYLLWIAVKAICNTFKPDELISCQNSKYQRLRGYYFQGLGLHLTNPKAALTWFTVTSAGLTASATGCYIWVLVISCSALGVIIFGFYALMFSSESAEHYLTSIRRSFDLICAGFYLLVAAGFLLSL